MKKVLGLSLVLLIGLSGITFADNITLNSPEALSVPTAASISEWEITSIRASDKYMSVRFRWRDSGGSLIQLNRSSWNNWTCQNKFEDTNPVNIAECTAAGVPDACCTGEGTGTCDDLVQTDSCFSDVFGFNIRAQDVGTSIGLGLRTLIWNQMKQDILDSNDGSFD